MNVISPETRIMGLPYGEEIMIVGRTMWTQSTSVTDRQTDRRTDGQNYDHKDRPQLNFLTFFPKWLGIFSPDFARLLYVPIYTGLQIFIQLPATLTKLPVCHIKRNQHNMLKMSTADRNAHRVIALNMA